MRLLMSFIVMFFCYFSVTALAAPTKAQRREYADRNDDGVVTRKEAHSERVWGQRQNTKVNTWWERRADTNNDGIIDAGELSSWKIIERERIDLNNDGVINSEEKRLCWRHARSRVSTLFEKRYDADGDGWLSPDEVREMLIGRYTVISTDGKVTVDTIIEEEYDNNKNGVIDAVEAALLKGDLGL